MRGPPNDQDLVAFHDWLRERPKPSREDRMQFTVAWMVRGVEAGWEDLECEYATAARPVADLVPSGVEPLRLERLRAIVRFTTDGDVELWSGATGWPWNTADLADAVRLYDAPDAFLELRRRGYTMRATRGAPRGELVVTPDGGRGRSQVVRNRVLLNLHDYLKPLHWQRWGGSWKRWDGASLPTPPDLRDHIRRVLDPFYPGISVELIRNTLNNRRRSSP